MAAGRQGCGMGEDRLTRRHVLAAAAIVLGGCAVGAGGEEDGAGGPAPPSRGSAAGTPGPSPRAQPGRGQLGARPAARPSGSFPAGTSRVGLAEGRDGLVHVPEGVAPDEPAPLVVTLHGAGGDAEGGLDPLLPFAAEFGAVLLSPESRGATWDVIRGGFGPDVTYLDRALALAFDRQAVDPARIAVSGFSDGASYALSIGLTNGELFSTVIAFSPGFAAPGPRQGDPQVFVSHGVADPVLPIDRCSRRIVPQLERDGYAVRYREFEGGHVVPADLARESLTYFSEAAEQTGET